MDEATMDAASAISRRMWRALEPFHAVTYFVARGA